MPGHEIDLARKDDNGEIPIMKTATIHILTPVVLVLGISSSAFTDSSQDGNARRTLATYLMEMVGDEVSLNDLYRHAAIWQVDNPGLLEESDVRDVARSVSLIYRGMSDSEVSNERPDMETGAADEPKRDVAVVERITDECAQQDYCLGDIVYNDSDPLLRGKIVDVIPNGRFAKVEFDRSGKIFTWPIDRLASSRTGCLREDEYCVSDFVYNNKRRAGRGQIVGIYGTERRLAVKYGHDEVWDWSREKLALTRGCANDKRFCVGDWVRANKASGRSPTGNIVGIYFQGDTVAIDFGRGEVRRWNISKLTRID